MISDDDDDYYQFYHKERVAQKAMPVQGVPPTYIHTYNIILYIQYGTIYIQHTYNKHTIHTAIKTEQKTKYNKCDRICENLTFPHILHTFNQ